MAASTIAISFDSLNKSVGSPPSQVILFGDIPTVIPSTSVVAPETSTIAPVISSAASCVFTIDPGYCHAWRSVTVSDSYPIGEAITFGRLTAPLKRAPLHSSGLDASDQAHSGSLTRDVPPRLCYPPRRAPRRSEAFFHWRAAPLSTLYPPTTSGSYLGDSSERPLHSSSRSTKPSRKRCRSLVDYVPSSMPVMGSLAPTRVDLLRPRKRFRDSYSSEASIEEDTEIDPIEIGVDMELGIGDGDDVRDHVEIDPRDVRDDTEEYEADASAGDTVEVGIDPMSAPIVEEEIIEPAGEDSFDSSGKLGMALLGHLGNAIDLDDVVHDFYHHMSEVHIDRIVGIETAQRRLEADQLIVRDRELVSSRGEL
ncbi:hypothetical protein Tco_0763485 [Tanacetum coccineum]